MCVQVVKEVIDTSATIEFKPNTADDPHKRKPDISKAKELLNWEPKISLRDGLPRMVSDFRNRILNEDEGKCLQVSHTKNSLFLLISSAKSFIIHQDANYCV